MSWQHLYVSAIYSAVIDPIFTKLLGSKFWRVLNFFLDQNIFWTSNIFVPQIFGKVKARLKKDQGKLKRRSRQGQGKVRARLG